MANIPPGESPVRTVHRPRRNITLQVRDFSQKCNVQKAPSETQTVNHVEGTAHRCEGCLRVFWTRKSKDLRSRKEILRAMLRTK